MNTSESSNRIKFFQSEVKNAQLERMIFLLQWFSIRSWINSLVHEYIPAIAQVIRTFIFGLFLLYSKNKSHALIPANIADNQAKNTVKNILRLFSISYLLVSFSHIPKSHSTRSISLANPADRYNLSTALSRSV